MSTIEINNLVKTYKTGTKALKGVSLSINQGDFFALLGANGAGKTTLIGILTGLVNKTSGTINVFGCDIDHDINGVKRMVGVVPQEFNFNMFELVEDIVTNQGGYFGIPYKQAKKDVEPILKKVGLWDKRRAMARTLSGGMKRRLMIARALIHKPRVLILDEPTAGVDVELRFGMWEYLRQINRDGTTILLTTHYLEEVEQMCRNMAIIKDGEIVRQGVVRELINSMPQDTYRITVKQMHDITVIAQYQPKVIDGNMIDIEVKQREDLNQVMILLVKAGFIIIDVHPKGNRLEKLFLNILQEKK